MKNFKELILATNLLLFTLTLNSQYLVSATELSSLSAPLVEAYLNSHGWDTSPMTINGVTSYKIIYNTTDVHGDPTVASGALYVPQLCDTMPLVSYQHGTEFHKAHVPSNNYVRDRGLLYSGNGFITTMPDYLGMGVNPGIHPYVHWESEATASIDLIRAAREYLMDELHIRDNNQLFLTGYSQGGHSTMAIHKYITVNNLQSEFNVVASAPMSGAFPLYDVQMPGIFNEDSTYCCLYYLAYAFASYQLVYGNLYENYNEYYDPPYDTQIPIYLSGNYTNAQWAALMPNNYYDLMQDSVIHNIKNNPNHPVNIDLRENDLHNWIPDEPVRMLYCGSDPVVFPENSIMAQDTMNALGATDVQAIEMDPYGNHSTCVVPAFTYALEWFDSLKVQCLMVGLSVPSVKKQPGISLYPNPFSTSTTIEYVLAESRNVDITIFNHLGQQVERIEQGNSQLGKQQFVWDASAMPAGIYFVQVKAGNEVTTRKMIKQ